MLKLVFVVMLMVPTFAIAKTCPAPKLCEEFAKQEAICEKNKRKCDGFVRTFKKLLDRHDCKRDFDKEPVPAVWLCSNHESSVNLLKTLKNKSAIQLLGSAKFKATLDGALVEGSSDGTEDK